MYFIDFYIWILKIYEFIEIFIGFIFKGGRYFVGLELENIIFDLIISEVRLDIFIGVFF